jgi:hypothetical protein
MDNPQTQAPYAQETCRRQKNDSVSSGAGIAYPSGAHEFTHGLRWSSCWSIFSFLATNGTHPWSFVTQILING